MNVKMIIEIPKDSSIKYEYDRKTEKIIVDRILRNNFKYPCNYGFIEKTLDWDGDELDVLLYSTETFIPGVELDVKIIGAMKMIDDGETDTKIIAIHSGDYRLESIKTIDDLPKEWIKSLETFFSTYKNWKKPGITKVPGFENATWAINEYNECVDLFKKYNNLPKEEFIAKMKKQHPEKYEI